MTSKMAERNRIAQETQMTELDLCDGGVVVSANCFK